MTSAYEPDPRRWKALTVTLVAGFMSLLDVSIVSVALPSAESTMTCSGTRTVAAPTRLSASRSSRLVINRPLALPCTQVRNPVCLSTAIRGGEPSCARTLRRFALMS